MFINRASNKSYSGDPDEDRCKRPPVQVSLGCPVKGLALPHADPQDGETMIKGVQKRFVMEPPPADVGLLAELKEFVSAYVNRKLTPLSSDCDLGLDAWLDGTTYPQWRKEELRKVFSSFEGDDLLDPEKFYTACKSFMKDETYVDFKHARGINSRTDTFKTFLGPIAKLIESEVYKLRPFIKHIPVRDRPRVIVDRLMREGAKYYATDYTAFEALFRRALMEAIEFVLYDYMTKDLHVHALLMEVCDKVLGGVNVCVFRTFIVRVLATRMSGEMVTSLGNGFSNLMIVKFLCRKLGIGSLRLFVEGDDCIASTREGFPSSGDFSRLGLIIKIEEHDDLCSASFCGIISDEIDQINVVDPLEVLVKTGWTTSQYARVRGGKLKTLLRCKALSMAYMYPGCPVVQEFAHYLLRATRSFDVRGFLERNKQLSLWERDQIGAAVRVAKDREGVEGLRLPVPIRTRVLVEHKFQLSVELQLKLEGYFRNLTDIQEIDIGFAADLVPQSWSDYHAGYARVASTNSPDLFYPPGTWEVLNT